MASDTIGGRPATITKEGAKIKIVFHPMSKAAKHPDASLFSITLTKSDIDALKKKL